MATCRELRVLNAIRVSSVGLPLTYPQYPPQWPAGFPINPSTQTVLTFTFQIQTFDSPGADRQVSLLSRLFLSANWRPSHTFASLSLSLRLVYRQLYPLAIKVCHYLKIPDYHGVSRVLRQWASCKVKPPPSPLILAHGCISRVWHVLPLQVQQKDLSDEAIAQAVCLKVGDSPGFSYSHIAAKAYECGRAELAIKVNDILCQCFVLALELS